MIEITLTEIVLFAWAIIATAYALKFKQELGAAEFFVRKLITDEAVRTQWVNAYKKFAKENGA